MGLSNHNKLISTVKKSSSFKGPLCQKIFRSYKNSVPGTSCIDLKTKWKTYIVSLRRLLEIFKRKHAPINVKKVIHNHDPFMTKDLRKEIMKKSKLENNFCKNWCNCKYQGNRFVNLLKKTKSIYFKNLNVRRTTDNKTFRQLNSTRSLTTRWHHGHTDKNKNTEHQN